MKEVEVKILEVDPLEIRKKFLAIDAKFVKKTLQRDLFYGNDYTRKKDIVVRMRLENGSNILTMKSAIKPSKSYKIREEYETNVGDAKEILNMFELLGLKKRLIREAKREYYSFNSCSLEIIWLPKIPPFIEVEGKISKIDHVLHLLGYSKKDYFPGSVLKKYNICGKQLVFK